MAIMAVFLEGFALGVCEHRFHSGAPLRLRAGLRQSGSDVFDSLTQGLRPGLQICRPCGARKEAEEMMDLSGRVAFVTGASQGIQAGGSGNARAADHPGAALISSFSVSPAPIAS